MYIYIYFSLDGNVKCIEPGYTFSIHLEEFLRFENKGGGGGGRRVLSYFLGRTFWREMKCGYSFLLFSFPSFFFPRLERYTRVLPWNNETGGEKE